MPGSDGNGPRGIGPVAGDDRGFCAVSLTMLGAEIDLMMNQLHALKVELAQIEVRIGNISAMEGKFNIRSKE